MQKIKPHRTDNENEKNWEADLEYLSSDPAGVDLGCRGHHHQHEPSRHQAPRPGSSELGRQTWVVSVPGSKLAAVRLPTGARARVFSCRVERSEVGDFGGTLEAASSSS